MIQVNGTIELGREIDAATQEAMVSFVRASRAEDGCLDYTFARDLADPNVLVLFERWRDREALAAHMASPHMAEFQKIMAANPPASRAIRLYETDDGEALG